MVSSLEAGEHSWDHELTLSPMLSEGNRPGCCLNDLFTNMISCLVERDIPPYELTEIDVNSVRLVPYGLGIATDFYGWR